MKTGNPKQAAILGVVAVAALGFLGSSLFSTFASGSTPTPVTAEENAKSPDANPKQPGSGDDKLPAIEPDESGSQNLGSDLPPKIEKTPFGKPETTKPSPQVIQDKQPSELPKSTRTGSQGERETVPLDPISGDHSGLPPANEMSTGGPDTPETADKPKPIMIRFEGFIDAGNPVAIIRIGDSQYTADQGEGLPYGIRVIAMTSEKLTLSIRGRRKSIWIGREVQL